MACRDPPLYSLRINSYQEHRLSPQITAPFVVVARCDVSHQHAVHIPIDVPCATELKMTTTNVLKLMHVYELFMSR